MQFDIGEKVLIKDNMDEVKELQEGYGGWASYMVKVGAIITLRVCGGV